jgi:tRNA-dihydrouridine synthase
MIGRAAIGNPWIFNEIKHYIKTGEILAPPSIFDRTNAALEHLEMSIKWKGEILALNEMKRHYSNYFKGIPHFKDYRIKLVTSFDLNEVKDTLNEIKEKLG